MKREGWGTKAKALRRQDAVVNAAQKRFATSDQVRSIEHQARAKMRTAHTKELRARWSSELATAKTVLELLEHGFAVELEFDKDGPTTIGRIHGSSRRNSGSITQG